MILGMASAAGSMAKGAYDDWRQRRQQEKLQEMQIEGSKEMGRFNQGLALDMWEKTNYAAQRRQMEKAGLNIGLMYGGGGAGGGTTSTPTGSVSGASAASHGTDQTGMAMQLGMQMEMQKASVDAIKANTEKTKVETAKIAGVDTEKIGQEIEQIKQGITNAKLQAAIMEYDKEIKRIETNIAENTQWDIISGVRTANDKLYGEAQQALAQGKIDEATYQEKIKQIEQNTIEQQLRMAGQKLGLIKTGEEIENIKAATGKIAEEIIRMREQTKQGERQLDQQEVKIILDKIQLQLNKKQTGFNTSDAAKLKQWTSIFTDIVNAGAHVGGVAK